MAKQPNEMVGLVEAIEALRGDLLELCDPNLPNRLRFRPAPIELTIQAVVSREARGKFGIKWWLADIGGEASRQSSATHTLKIVLTPVIHGKDGQQAEELLISDSDGNLRGDAYEEGW